VNDAGFNRARIFDEHINQQYRLYPPAERQIQ
jgi:hypothetical protein